jgi:hypothetical protein
MGMTIYTLQLPETLYKQLARQAEAEHRSIDDYVRETLSRRIAPLVPLEDDLPMSLRVEFEAMEQLSDASLWSIARSTVSEQNLAEWDALLNAAQQRTLSVDEERRKQQLGREYDETILRRAHAAMLLKSRGYDLADPTILQA